MKYDGKHGGGFSETPRYSIAAIETHYKGVRFRSRLEARWAVFFDALEIAWRYESEGFKLATGYYVADFYLPQFDLWIEVKPTHPTSNEIAACESLAAGIPGRVRIVYGDLGWWQWSTAIDPQRHGGIGFWCEAESGGERHGFADHDTRYRPALCLECGWFGIEKGGEMPPCPPERHATLPAWDVRFDNENRIRVAVEQATSYRFDLQGGR